jgi:2'-hydroxyisoflavone reductase
VITKKMKILIIGGTKFLGRYLVESALARGHEVTLFNRGLTNPELFPDVEHLQGDRHQDLDVLRKGRWDAAIDTCGYSPNAVSQIAEILSRSINHYTFISSQSVYAGYPEPNQDENAPIQTMDEDLNDETNAVTYGARKAVCEQAAENALPDRVLSIRAGMIVGPYDYIDRFSYWVNRVSQGGEVLSPGAPERPVQLIDVRDLAEWNIKMVESGQTGVYNATGPDYKLTFGEFLETCRTASGSDASFNWISEEFLLANDVKPWSELPFWYPGEEGVNFFSIDCRKAFQSGLKFRPLIETAKDTLNWYAARDKSKDEPERPLVAAQGQIGLTSEREKELLRLWREKY